VGINARDPFFNEPPIFFALIGGSAEAYRLLVSRGASLSPPPSYNAVAVGFGAEPRSRNLMDYATAAGIIEAMEELYKANPGCINARNTHNERPIVYLRIHHSLFETI